MDLREPAAPASSSGEREGEVEVEKALFLTEREKAKLPKPFLIINNLKDQFFLPMNLEFDNWKSEKRGLFSHLNELKKRLCLCKHAARTPSWKGCHRQIRPLPVPSFFKIYSNVC